MGADVDRRGYPMLRWNPNELGIRTKSVERVLEPLIMQVTTFVDLSKHGGVSLMKKGRSKKAADLVAAVDRAIEHFITEGMQVVESNPQARDDLLAALEEVRQTGQDMSRTSRDFVSDPNASNKRTYVVSAARALLGAVVRLMCVADMLDVHVLLSALAALDIDLEAVRDSMSQDELNRHLARLMDDLANVGTEAGRRAADLKDPNERDDLCAARAMLKSTSLLLNTASKALLRHPEVDQARANRDWALNHMRQNARGLAAILEGQEPGDEVGLQHGRVGDLAAALDDFDQRVCIDPRAYRGETDRAAFEEQLERIISGSALIADSACTRDDRKHRIVAECNAVRQALQDLLSQYERNVGRRETSEELDLAVLHVNNKTRDLRRHLRRAVVDHVSDSFLDTTIPLLMLVEAARQGDEAAVEEYGAMFLQHADKLVEVANLVCQMCSNEDGVKMVQYAALQVRRLAPQVVNAARLLASRPKSTVAQENMNAFKESWEERVRVLTLAVDSILTVDDFLAVSEAHILEDVNASIKAVVAKDGEALDRTAGAIRGRALRVCQVVDADMDTYIPSAYTEKVRNAVRVVRTDVLPSFARRAEVAVDALSQSPAGAVDQDEFIDAAKAVYDAIRDIRHAVLLNRHIDEIDSDEEYEYEKGSSVGAAADRDGDDAETTDRAMMGQLPAEERRQIQAQVQLFNLERQRFQREVARWDDTGNDIVALAKHMCMIMMEMTDFTRGRGPLKNTMDVINAAQKISECGGKLNKLAEKVATESVESETKKDLLAYMQRITLYCHQLNITSKVKADVTQVGEELVVSGLESATSLIQAAKNLLSSVVLTVKSAYIASTKYPSKSAKTAKSNIVWRMCAPEKLPLYRTGPNGQEVPIQQQAQTPTGGTGIIRRASQKREMAPMKMLQQFRSPDSDL